MHRIAQNECEQCLAHRPCVPFGQTSFSSTTTNLPQYEDEQYLADGCRPSAIWKERFERGDMPATWPKAYLRHETREVQHPTPQADVQQGYASRSPCLLVNHTVRCEAPLAYDAVIAIG